MSIRVAGIAGSLREGSFNKGLLRAAVELAPAGMEITIYPRLGDYRHTTTMYSPKVIRNRSLISRRSSAVPMRC